MHTAIRAALGAAAFAAMPALPVALPTAAQTATPAAYSCESAGTAAGKSTPMAGHDAMGMGTPTAGMAAGEAEVDRLYIDMMVPHHGSIVALAQAALPRLTDERLVAVAENIIATQQAEMEELRGHRERLFGSPESMPMSDPTTMEAMMAAMPGMGHHDDMAMQMDAAKLVAAFCAADDANLAFIDLVIPHHEAAVAASRDVLDTAADEEIRAFVRRVIDDQAREIEELEAIRAKMVGGTPAAR